MNKIKEILMAVGLIIILVFLLNPFDIYYSNMVLMSSLTVLILLFIFFSIFILKDKPVDEREEAHQSFAGRVAYLCGTAVMITGIVVQSISHSIDIWLVVALGVMIVSKLLATTHIERNN
jgi:hypothetical protein